MSGRESATPGASHWPRLPPRGSAPTCAWRRSVSRTSPACWIPPIRWPACPDSSRPPGSGGCWPAWPRRRPPSAREWSAFLWESLERHRLGAIAAWNMSETAATGTLDGMIEAGHRYELPDVAKAYETIVKDERFHIGLGRAMLERYVE